MRFNFYTFLIPFLFLIFCINNLYGLKPARSYKLTPDKVNLNYETHDLETPDECFIHTWKILPKPDIDRLNQTVIIAYGDAGNMGYTIPYAMRLIERGYTVIVFDYRAFGQSSDYDINENQSYYNEFATDMVTVLKWAKQQNPSHKINIWGFSMGTTIATLAYQTERFDLLIGEGFVTNPLRIQKRIKTLKDKDLVLPADASLFPQKLAQINIPIFFIAGTKDNITTLADSQAAVEGFDNRQLLAFEGGHGAGGFTLGMQEYIDAIESFLKKHQ